MPGFVSIRERKLWLCVAVVMAAIYSSLGVAQTVAGELRERNLLRISLAAALVLLGTPVVVRWLKSHPSRREIGVAAGVTAVYLWTAARAMTPEERTHLIEYAVVAALIDGALSERARHGRRIPMPAVLTVALTALLGFLDECVQSLLPGRAYDVRDVGFNALAGVMAVTPKLATRFVRRRWIR